MRADVLHQRPRLVHHGLYHRRPLVRRLVHAGIFGIGNAWRKLPTPQKRHRRDLVVIDA